MTSKRTVRLLVLLTAVALLTPSGPTASPRGAALAAGASAPATTFVVTTTDDETGECTADYCSLRQAIEAANANPGADTITFDIPTSDPGYDPNTGQWTIHLSVGQLPALADPGTIIDATQGGDCSSPVVIDATGVSYAMEITGTNHTISGLVLRNANTYGLYIHGSGAQSNTLSCSYVISNTVDGVHIADQAAHNSIGSTGADRPNVIALNGDDGIEITGAAHHNTVVCNYIGTDLSGATAYPNSGYGVRISGGAMTNTVGLVGQCGNNLISGNTLGDVMISGSTTHGNVVQNNRIGTESGGTAVIAGLNPSLQNDGVVIAGASYNTIGPDNLISGHGRDGVRIQDNTARYNVVKGNYIGTDADGDARVTNKRFGVWLQGETHHNTIGAEAAGNLISGNGYDGDFPMAGGVALVGSSSHNLFYNNSIGMTAHGAALPNGGPGVWVSEGSSYNEFGNWTSPTHANTIAWNEGDGVLINGTGTLHNTLYRNSIHDNTGLGINNESGGNRELVPPQILRYQTLSFGSGSRTVSLHARTCLTCTVIVYYDDGGEGRVYEKLVSSLDPNGQFDWNGNIPLYSAVTLVATDADGNSSEFSASPVELRLSLDDALPHVVVNKVPGDADAPAGNVTVDFVATIVSRDPTLRNDFDLELRLSDTTLGNPTRVFTRAQASDYNGTPVTWSNPSAGVFRVQGIDLAPDTNSASRWTQRVILRFDVPNGASPTALLALGFLTAEGRTLNQEVDYAVLRLLQRADEIIITNRTQLYAQYDDTQTTTFLQDLHAFAQGPPFNWTPASVIYYVDTFDSSLATWDNTAVSYASEAVANTAANKVDSLIEDWVEDSTTRYQKICSFIGGCHSYPVDYPWYLLIAGDDNIIPFYRKDDPADREIAHPCPSSGSVLCALRNHDYFFTENSYGDLSYVFDTFPWNEGGVELAVGRLVGTRAAHMSTLLHNGQYGPDTTRPARAIVGSACGNDAQGVVNHLKNYGYDVLNDTESPSTVDNDNWSESTLLTLMQGDYQIFHHGNHANEGGWTTPPCSSLPSIDTNDVWSSAIAARIAANHPIFTSNGCRAGLAAARADTNPLSITTSEPTMVNALVREGASAVMASTGISFFDADYGDIRGGEDFIKDFWGLAASPPPKQLNMGMALRWNKRTWDGHWSVDDEEEKTGAEFTLYGIPWVTAPYRAGTTSQRLRSSAGVTLSPPQPLGGQTYVVTATFDASNYSVNQVNGFDLVNVEGMELARDTAVPLVPLAEVELNLPSDGTLVDVEAVTADPVNLGTLNIPQEIPGVPIPGGDSGGLTEAPDIGVYPPQGAVSRTVSLAGYNLARVYGSPLSYDTTTDQATLYQSLALRITYHLSSTVGLLNLTAAPDDLAPEEPFSVTATLANPGADPATLTGTLTLKDNLGRAIDVLEIGPFDVAPGGEQYPLELGWTAPFTEGAYSLLLELYHAGAQQVFGHQTLAVSGGRITALTAPTGALSGQEATFEVTFANRRGDPFEGQVALSIYDGEGAFVTTLDAPLSTGAESEETVRLTWDTEGEPAGSYTALAEVTDAAESVTYGPAQESFDLRHAVYLPLILK